MTLKEKLDDALISCDYEQVNHLLDEGVEIDINNSLLDLTNGIGYTFEIVDKFIKAGSNVNQNVRGITPLFNVSYHCKKDIIKLLVDNGAEVNHKNKFGVNCLMNCVGSPFFNIDSFLYLIKVGADPKCIDVDGESIVDYAIKSNLGKDIIDVIKKVFEQNLPFSKIQKMFKKCMRIELSQKDKVKIVYGVISYSFNNNDYDSSWNYIGEEIYHKRLIGVEFCIASKQYLSAITILQQLKGHNYFNLDCFVLLEKILIGVGLNEESKIVRNIILKIIS